MDRLQRLYNRYMLGNHKFWKLA